MRAFSPVAPPVHVATVGGSVGLIVVPDDRLRLAVALTFDGERIVGLHAIADQAALSRIDVTLPA